MSEHPDKVVLTWSTGRHHVPVFDRPDCRDSLFYNEKRAYQMILRDPSDTITVAQYPVMIWWQICC